MKNKEILERINIIESEFESYNFDKNQTIDAIDENKKKLINEVKSGVLDEYLNDMKNRVEKKKKETFIDKLIKILKI